MSNGTRPLVELIKKMHSLSSRLPTMAISLQDGQSRTVLAVPIFGS